MKRTCFQKSVKTNGNMTCEFHTTFKNTFIYVWNEHG